MNIIEILTVFSVGLLRFVLAEEQRLSEYVHHYEGLTYDREALHTHHSRAKRSISDPYVHLVFHAHGRHFNLRLRRDTSTFSSDFTFEQPDGSTKVGDTSHIVEGEVWGEPASYVHGSIIQGVFSGKIYTTKDNYYVERADVYFEPGKDGKDFHSVIYNERHINPDPHRYRRSATEGSCGSSRKDIHDWMESIQRSAVPIKMTQNSKHTDNSKKTDSRKDSNHEQSDHKREDHHSGSNIYSESHNSRTKRETADSRRTCTLFLQSDPLLWDRMTKAKDMDGLAYGRDRAHEEITSLFASHVNGIRQIYEDTRFTDGSREYKGISFVVRRIKIQTNEDCPDNEDSVEKFCKPNIDVSNFLNLNSLRNHNDFCLAYVFTYRDFTGGTLGLAWVGSPTRASGGICEKWKEYQENNAKIWKSLNTGIVTLINYNSPVPPKVSTLTFAHEVGHNFGSPHDSGQHCTPFSSVPPHPDGNFIMYASATSGDRPNNSKFSPCSKSNITQVLDAVFNENFGKTNCFVERESAFCGNNIKEEDEQCDCGYKEDCNDECCHGRNEPNQCKLRGKVQCSPSEGPCCLANCTKVSRGASLECSADSDCNGKSECNGIDAFCPRPTPKENMTSCNKDTKVCISGECVGSICQKINWAQCFLTAPKEDKGFDKGKLCFVACQRVLATGDCISTGDEDALNEPENQPLKRLLQTLDKQSIQLPPGAPCNDFRGYCDVFQKCRDVDADGPLARLKKLLFNEQTFNKIKNWIIEYWWGVLLIVVGLIVFMGIFIKLCAVHTPSSNPKKPPARKLTLRPQHRHQGPPPPYVGPSRGGPPHGKGRGPAGRGANYEMQPQKV